MAKIFPDLDYLGQFELSREHIYLPDKVFLDLDASIRSHIVFDNEDLERYLIAQAEFLSTFSTAKVEEVNDLSANEARKILGNILGFDEAEAGSSKKELDAQEFKNIVRGFRLVCNEGLSAESLSVGKLKGLHQTLTEDLDRLSYSVSGAGPEYKSGMFRDGDVWIGGIYTPARHADIEKELLAAISYYQQNQTVADCFVFSLAVYAIHPFNNGNKRVCRIMEHGLLRSLGINRENMYSHIVETYHTIERYKDALQASLSRKILNNFVNLQLESLFWAQMHTLRAAVEYGRQKLIDGFLQRNTRKHLPELLGLFVTAKALQYKDIKAGLNSINDKSVVTLLKWCLEQGMLRKHIQGRDSYYSLVADSAIERDITRFYEENRKRVSYTPDIFFRSILQHADYFSPGAK